MELILKYTYILMYLHSNDVNSLTKKIKIKLIVYAIGGGGGGGGGHNAQWINIK